MAIDAPWLAVAGLGALHGLNPATGWILATASGLRSGDRRRALRALAPIAAGHAASVALGASARSARLRSPCCRPEAAARIQPVAGFSPCRAPSPATASQGASMAIALPHRLAAQACAPQHAAAGGAASGAGDCS